MASAAGPHWYASWAMKGTVAIRCPCAAATSARTVSSVTRAHPVPRRPATRRMAAHPPKGCSGRDIALTITRTWPRTRSSTAAGCAARSCARSSARSSAPTADTRATAPIPERAAVAVTIDEALRLAAAEAARGVVTFPADLHGFPGVAHGGAVAAVFHRLTLPRPPVALRVELTRGVPTATPLGLRTGSAGATARLALTQGQRSLAEATLHREGLAAPEMES